MPRNAALGDDAEEAPAQVQDALAKTVGRVDQTKPMPYSGPARDPYATGPTDYTSMDRYYESNAGAAQNEAKQLNQHVTAEAQQAQGTLNNLYTQQRGQIYPNQQSALDAGTAYSGPTGLGQSEALQKQYATAEQDRNALGSTGGIQTLLGPHGSAFSAGLVNRAGHNAFKKTQDFYGGLDSDIGNRDQQIQREAGAAQTKTAANQAILKQEADAAQHSKDYQAYVDKVNAANANQATSAAHRADNVNTAAGIIGNPAGALTDWLGVTNGARDAPIFGGNIPFMGAAEYANDTYNSPSGQAPMTEDEWLAQSGYTGVDQPTTYKSNEGERV